jgi:hypothetical protein
MGGPRGFGGAHVVKVPQCIQNGPGDASGDWPLWRHLPAQRIGVYDKRMRHDVSVYPLLNISSNLKRVLLCCEHSRLGHACSGGHSSGFGSYWNKYYTDGYSSTARRQVMVHELGHAIGLGHSGSPSCSGQPIMYANSNRYFTCGRYAPQQDDINGINYLY